MFEVRSRHLEREETLPFPRSGAGETRRGPRAGALAQFLPSRYTEQTIDRGHWDRARTSEDRLARAEMRHRRPSEMTSFESANDSRIRQ